MLIRIRLASVAAVCAFLIASARASDAQRGQGSGSGQRGGASAAPRPAQGRARSTGDPVPPRGPRPVCRRPPPQGPSPGGGGRPTAGPGYRPGPGNSSGGTGSWISSRYGPGYRPGYGYRATPAYGYRGYYPATATAVTYPWYGYRGYYPWYIRASTSVSGHTAGPTTTAVRPTRHNGYYGSYDSGTAQVPAARASRSEVKPKSADVVRRRPPRGHRRSVRRLFDSLSARRPASTKSRSTRTAFRSHPAAALPEPRFDVPHQGDAGAARPGEPNEPRPQRALPPQQPERRCRWRRSTARRSLSTALRSRRAAARPPAPDSQPPLLPELSIRAGGHSRSSRPMPRCSSTAICGTAGWCRPLLVYLSPGTHRVEIRKEGYDAFVTAVEIKRGEVTPLNVSLASF